MGEIRTFLIADVRGYTRFAHERGDEAAASLGHRFAKTARGEIEARGGMVLDARGDEVAAVFVSPRDAIRAAVGLQARFAAETRADPMLPLNVGIGLDAGEAVATDGGYRGGALNLAARLCSLAGPGEVLISRPLAHLARKIEGIDYFDRGEVALKGLPEAVGVVAVSSAGDGEEPSAALSYEARPLPGRGGRVRVVVADDHPFFRDGVSQGLARSGQVEVVAQAENGREAIEAIRRERPDVALVDYKLPELDGVAVVRAVVRDQLPTRVLLLSAFTEGALVFDALQEGAAGYLPKDARRPEIVDAVLRVARGETVVPAHLAGGLAGEIRLRARPDAPVLSERERQVLEGFARGLSGPQVAAELFIEASTVKTHAQRLYEKLGVSDRAAAVAEAMRRGLLE